VNRFDYHGEFLFPLTPDELWQCIARFDRFESWWPWLRSFSADGDGLLTGNTLHAVVAPPVPVQLRLDVHLRACDRPRLVAAAISGDLRGSALLRFADVNGGTRATADWSLETTTAALRLTTRVAYPVMRWGHDRVVEMAVAGFRRKALPESYATRGPSRHR
jgi:hypothetical protein